MPAIWNCRHCCRGLDTLHVNRTPHHQMKALIRTELLLSLITVAMALSLSSLQSIYLFPFHHLIIPWFLSPLPPILSMCTVHCQCVSVTQP